MKIHVTGESSLKSIQQEFSKLFPNLKIEFFSKPHNAFEGTSAQYLIKETDVTLNDIKGAKHEGWIYLEPDMLVWQIEKFFQDEFHLSMQIFRRSGNVWLETSRTDNLSLEEQNELGNNINKAGETPVDDQPYDYREQP